MAECDSLGRVPFLAAHGYDVARWLYVEHRGLLYDSKAIAGVALQYEYGPEYVRDREGYTGGEQTVVPVLRNLGFDVVDSRVTSVDGRVAPKLVVGRTYTWDELGRRFGFSPRYFSVGGGMLALKKLNILLVVTHLGGAKSFDYGDYWDGRELVYTGKGLNGPQMMRGENRDAAENRRTNYVFAHAGSHRLTFLGIGRCIDWRPDTAPGRDGIARRIFRFRFAFNGVSPRPGSTSAARRRSNAGTSTRPQAPPPRAAVRRPREFDPDRPPRSYSNVAAGPGRTAEETGALKEKAVEAHHQILVELHKALRAAGWLEITEIPAAIDLQGQAPSGIRVLFEAKTLSGKNESDQVRRALAQLLEYRFLYGLPEDELCLVTNGPIDERRDRLLHALGIEFAWVDSGGFHTSGSLFRSAVASFDDSARKV